MGEEHPDTLLVMGNLITTCINLQYYTRAVEMFERLYEIRSHTLGANHSDTVLARNKLVEAYKKAGKSEKMISNLLDNNSKAVDIMKNLLRKSNLYREQVEDILQEYACHLCSLSWGHNV